MREILSGNEAIARGAWEAGVQVGRRLSGHAQHRDPGEHRPPTTTSTASGRPTRRWPWRWASAPPSPAARALVRHEARGPQRGRRPAVHRAPTRASSGGLVIVTADDPGLHSSQNEQDNRHYAKFAKVPDARALRQPGGQGLRACSPSSSPRSSTRRSCCAPPPASSHSKSLVELGERPELGSPHAAREEHRQVHHAARLRQAPSIPRWRAAAASVRSRARRGRCPSTASRWATRGGHHRLRRRLLSTPARPSPRRASSSWA